MESLKAFVEAVLKRLFKTAPDPAGDFPETPVPCFEINADATLVRVNPAACALFGYREPQMLGYPVWHFAPPEERAARQEEVLRKLGRGSSPAAFEQRYLRRGGEVAFVEAREMFLYDEYSERHISGMRSFLVDITDRKVREQALAEKAGELARSNAELKRLARAAAQDMQEKKLIDGALSASLVKEG